MATSRMFVKVFRQSGRFSRCRQTKRGFCSSPSTGGDITTISLSQPIPGITPQFAKVNSHSFDTEVTVLENGMRVASENKFGQSCTVGILIDSGSRYEVAYPSGISHFLEKLSFSSTTEFENNDQILLELSKHGGICDSQSSRDTLIYAMSAETRGLRSLINILSEVTLRPKILDGELENARAAIGFELQSLEMNPNPESVLMEMIHTAAFKGNTLGLAKFCPEDSLPVINKNVLYTYMKNFHTPERIVLAGVGMDHKPLVDLAREYFIECKKPIWEEEPNLIDGSKHVDKSIAQYTGGEFQIEKDLSDISLGPTPLPNLAHVVFGLESCAHKDDDFIAFCVLNMIMGGGGSFSAGGPGKGMYSRLYLNVLNRHHWINNATAYNHAYDDSGLFCIHASSHPDQLNELTRIITDELVNTSGTVNTEELNRAKTQLQSMLLMNLEARPVTFEDIGRQVLANGFRHQPEHYYDLIGKITVSDIQRVAERMLSSKLTLAALGSLGKLPDMDTIQSMLYKRSNSLKRKFMLFK